MIKNDSNTRCNECCMRKCAIDRVMDKNAYAVIVIVIVTFIVNSHARKQSI